MPLKIGLSSNAKPEILAPDGIVTVPVNVGEASGAFSPIEFVIVVEKFASAARAVDNSFNVFNVAGAPPTKLATCPSVYVLAVRMAAVSCD